MLWADSADNKLIFFLIFPRKIGSGTSCKLSPKETICIKGQILFSRKNKKKIFQKCHQLKFLPRMQSVKRRHSLSLQANSFLSEKNPFSDGFLCVGKLKGNQKTCLPCKTIDGKSIKCIALDKILSSIQKYCYFSYFSMQTYVVGTY